MIQMQSEELSALLDGELDVERAAQVRAMIEADPALRSEYEALVQLDVRLRQAAAASVVMPDTADWLDRVSTSAPWWWAAGMATVLGLLTIRLLPKFADVTAMSLCLQIAAWAVMLGIVLRLTRGAEPLAATKPAPSG